MLRFTVAMIAAAGLECAGAAVAQQAQEQPEPAKPVLGGPKVEPAAAERVTLVQRDFAGKIVRLEVPPAEAAVRAIELDAPTREKVDAVLLERARLLDGLVTGNLELLVKLHAAREGKDVETARRLQRELLEKAGPLRERGRLMEDLAKVLTPEQAAQVRALAEEYWDTVVAEEVAARRAAAGGDNEDDAMQERAPAEGERRGPARRGRREGGRGDEAAVRRELMLAMVGAEMRRAYERTIGAAGRDFTELLKDLNVTPEQESAIRKLVGDSFQKNYGKAPPRERARVFGEVWKVLDAEQRAELTKRLGGDGRAERPR